MRTLRLLSVTGLALAAVLSVIALTLALIASAHAADTGSFSAPSHTAAPADPLAPARALIKQDKWVAAIDELRRVGMSGNADWNNLMGYSHRKAKVPDLAAAERYYDAALAIEPKHRGALEYSGELFVQKGDLAKAESRLSTLTQVCGQCEERAALQKAIESFKASGHKLTSK